MKLTLGIGLSHSNGSAASPVGPTITAAGSIDVSTFKIGTTQTITAGTATATGGGSIAYEVRHLANGEVKSTSAAYAHIAADDTETGAAQWRAVETGGSNDGNTTWQNVAIGTITRVAPVAAGGLSNQSFTENTGVQTYDASGDFTGADITYSLVSPVTGVSINSSTGVVSFDTDAMATQTGTSIVVRGANSGGNDTSGFSLDIVVGNTAPSISGVPTISGTTTEGQTLTATAASVTGTPTPTRTWQWKRGGVNISGATNSTYTLQAADVGSTITVEQTETNVAGNDSATSAATATITGIQITLTSVSFSGSAITGNVNVPGTVYWMITDNATETAANVIAGTGAIDGGSFAVTSGSNNSTISYPNTPAGNHYLHVVADNATSPNPSVVDSAQYTFTASDTTAPVLSSATDAANGATASTGSVSTDEGNGTLYWVVTTSSTAPSAAQVKAGQDNTGTAADGDSGSQAVSATGVQNITPSGLTASTAYTTHFMHEDSSSNQSTVVSASGFTTAAASSELLPDPGFDDPTKWIADTGVTVQNSAAEVRSPAVDATLLTEDTGEATGLSAGTDYTWGMTVGGFVSGGDILAALHWLDSGGNFISTVGPVTVTISADGTTEFTNLNAPANTGRASWEIVFRDTGMEFDVTSASIRPS